MSTIQTIFVTGGTGFVGSNVVEQLLVAGYKVRAAARSKTAPVLAEKYRLEERLEVVVVDDIASSDLTDALKGVDAIIHVASPIPSSSTTAEIILQGAVQGTRHILESALRAGIYKIVITSSIVALASYKELLTKTTVSEHDSNLQTYEEAIQPGVPEMEVYSASKGLADRTTWEFAKAHPELDIIAVYPPRVLGKTGRGQIIDVPTNGTNNHIYRLITGGPGSPIPAVRGVLQFVNVRDLARAHVLALRLPPRDRDHGGAPLPPSPKRILVSGGEYNWVDAVRHLRKVRPELAHRFPVEGDADPEIPPHATYDASSAARLIGLTDYISFEDTVVEVIDDALTREKAPATTL